MSSTDYALAHLTIDLSAIAANYQTLRVAHPYGAVAAVVKADGYGLGALKVGKRLFRDGCRHFFVANFDEALSLHTIAPTAMIATLTGIAPDAVREQAARCIIPVINSLPELALWRSEAHRLGRTLPTFIHLDTGMNRLGLTPAEAAQISQNPALLSGIDLRCLLTHLVSPEQPDDPMNRTQLTRFRAQCTGLPRALKSIAASSGIFLGPEFVSDIARPGAALYGVNPTPARPNPMLPAVGLTARVLQVRDISIGESVGYNGIWRAERPSRIATIGAGYADGLLRNLSNHGGAVFDGTPLPLVGRVSMDLITFDATERPDLTAGATLELIGPRQPVEVLAAQADTSPYEILTSLGARYARRWLGE